VLRRWSIDELPQLINVIKGDMSLVGPRPFPTTLIDCLPADFREHRRQVAPGLTGLWQVSGRSANDLHELRRLDEAYLRDQSLAYDFQILVRTPRAVLAGVGAG
jgi:lipopolysaccharide/colanic/teichoic acid biosynthesis glycosyltransferase